MHNTSERSALGAVIGLVAGVVATGPMTVAMILWHRRLPRKDRYPLPPREITMKLARAAGLADKMSVEARSAATLLAHFAYGSAAGAMYGAISAAIPAPAALKGVGFGLFVWSGSYLGWLPGVGVLHMATDHPMRRNLLMVGVHVIWGATLGLVTELFADEARARGQQPFSTPHSHHRDVK